MYIKTETEATAAAGFATKQWPGPVGIASDNKKCPFTFLYIGKNDKAADLLSSAFLQGTAAENFAAAEQIINSLIVAEEQLPDAVFIDLPLQRIEVVSFCLFLRKKNILHKTVLLLSETQRQCNQPAFYQCEEYIDDVIDFTSSTINYASKIAFLRRCKIQHYAFGQEKKEVTLKHTFKSSVKRLLDIILALAIILLLLPVFLLIALAIRLESKGPVIYTSFRAGKGFKVFRFFKFRTMEVNADKKIASLAHLNLYQANGVGPSFFKVNHDPRITKVGRFLRNTSLDEVPQLFNVLIGDMSLVGNRPLPLYEASTLTTNEYVERFMAPAGITGLWQVKKRGQANMSTEERINLDISYARKSNLLFDFWIMANTPKALFQKTDV